MDSSAIQRDVTLNELLSFACNLILKAQSALSSGYKYRMIMKNISEKVEYLFLQSQTIHLPQFGFLYIVLLSVEV